MSEQTTDVVAALREACAKYSDPKSDFGEFAFTDAVSHRLPTLLDELEQLRGAADMARELIVDAHISILLLHSSPPYAWEIRVNGIDVDQKKSWASIREALAWLRSDIGKAAVARLKGET